MAEMQLACKTGHSTDYTARSPWGSHGKPSAVRASKPHSVCVPPPTAPLTSAGSTCSFQCLSEPLLFNLRLRRHVHKVRFGSENETHPHAWSRVHIAGQLSFRSILERSLHGRLDDVNRLSGDTHDVGAALDVDMTSFFSSRRALGIHHRNDYPDHVCS